MAQFFSTIGRHDSDRTGCWTWVSPHRKEAISLISAQFYHMPGRYERVCVGWHCAKVKGHAELKIEKPRVKTFIYDFPKLHHSSPNSFSANVHLCQIFLKTVKVIERSRDVTPRSKVKRIEGAPKVPLCTKYGAIPTIISGVMTFWKKMAHAIFFRSASILKVLVWPNWFSNLSERSETPCKTKRIPP